MKIEERVDYADEKVLMIRDVETSYIATRAIVSITRKCQDAFSHLKVNTHREHEALDKQRNLQNFRVSKIASLLARCKSGDILHGAKEASSEVQAHVVELKLRTYSVKAKPV